MSQPRKAMMEMGFQGCCLRCDAQDIVNLPRCGDCIGVHRQIRNMIADNDGSSEILQHMSDLFQMLANPEKYDNDEIHGKELVKQQRLIGSVDYERGFQYPDEIENLFKKDSKQSKSLMSDLINKNPWKNKPPSSEVARVIGEETWLDEELSNISYDGKKTIPFGQKGYSDFTLSQDKQKKEANKARHKKNEGWSDPETAGCYAKH